MWLVAAYVYSLDLALQYTIWCMNDAVSNELLVQLQVSTSAQQRKVGVSKAQENKGLIDVQPVRGTRHACSYTLNNGR